MNIKTCQVECQTNNLKTFKFKGEKEDLLCTWVDINIGVFEVEGRPWNHNVDTYKNDKDFICELIYPKKEVE